MWMLPEQKEGFFNDTQKEQVIVLFNALQPGDLSRKIPNAEESGAVHYIDLLLKRDESVFEDIPKWKTLYPKVLQALEEQSVLLFSKSLKDLSADETTTLIAKLETITLVNFQASGEKLDQASVFDTLRRHCIQGCFADTRWGGNTNKMMWKWFGYQEETRNL